jgi:hypothetical protein
MIESPVGRRGSLASSTFVTAFFCVVFVLVESPFAVRASTVAISLSATVGFKLNFLSLFGSNIYSRLDDVGSVIRVSG